MKALTFSICLAMTKMTILEARWAHLKGPRCITPGTIQAKLGGTPILHIRPHTIKNAKFLHIVFRKILAPTVVKFSNRLIHEKRGHGRDIPAASG